MPVRPLLVVALIAPAGALAAGGCGNGSPFPPAVAPDSPAQKAQRAKVENYVAESRRWYDEELARLEMIVDGFRRSAGFKDLGPIWQVELDKHKEAGLQPMYFGQLRTVEGEGQIREITWSFELDRLGYVDSARIIGFVDGEGTFVSVRDDPPQPRRRVLVKRVDLSGHREGDLVSLPGMMQVSGTTTYTSGQGREVSTFVLEPFDIEPFRDIIPPGMLRD